MHVTIRHYQMKAGSLDDALLRRVNEGFIPIIKKAPGFLAYYVVDSGGDTLTTVSVFEDRAGAEASNRRAADWVKQNLASAFPNAPQIIAGEVGAYELNLPKLGVRKASEMYAKYRSSK